VKCPVCGYLKKKRRSGHKICIQCESRKRPAAHTKNRKKRKEWDECGHSTRWERRIRAKRALEQIGIPASEVQDDVPAAQIVTLSTAERRRFRRAASDVHLPCEQSCIKTKLIAAASFATETRVMLFPGQVVAHLTDPIKFVNIIAQQSSYISIGVDTGNSTTKIGVGYEYEDTTRYAALMITSGKDNYSDMKALKNMDMHYIGESARYKHIFEVLQHIINDERVNRKVYLHADWNGLNAILGLKSAVSLNPCPICLVRKSELNTLKMPPLRHYKRNGAHAQKDEALLDVRPDRIVPLPLHIYLGLCNKIIGKVAAGGNTGPIKTHTLNASSGRSRLHDLTGPEVSRYIKKKLLSFVTPPDGIDLDILQYWMEQLHMNLLHKKRWEHEQENEFSSFVDQFLINWEAATNTRVTPKCHMLTHCRAFVAAHHHLARYGEAQMESYHATFRYTEQHNHGNQGNNTAERLRRTLADKAMLAAAPFLRQ
jgi:hypothetical protein